LIYGWFGLYQSFIALVRYYTVSYCTNRTTVLGVAHCGCKISYIWYHIITVHHHGNNKIQKWQTKEQKLKITLT